MYAILSGGYRDGSVREEAGDESRKHGQDQVEIDDAHMCLSTSSALVCCVKLLERTSRRALEASSSSALRWKENGRVGGEHEISRDLVPSCSLG